MKLLSVLLAGLLGFIVVGDHIDTIVNPNGNGHYQINYDQYCATKVARVGNKWRITLTNGETVDFTDPAGLRLDYSRPCQ